MNYNDPRIDFMIREEIERLEDELDNAREAARLQLHKLEQARLGAIKTGAAVKIRAYEDTKRRPIDWKSANLPDHRLKLLTPEKTTIPNRHTYGTRTQVSWKAIRDPKTHKPVLIKPGSVGYIFSTESPFAGKKSTMIRIHVNGWDGWTHINNLEVYDHEG